MVVLQWIIAKQQDYWHQRSASQWVAVRRSFGNDINGMLFSRFSPRYFFPFFFLWRPFLIEGVLGYHNLFSKSCSAHPITYVSTILGPPGSHLDFSRLYGIAGGEQMPSALLGWYFPQFKFLKFIPSGSAAF